jgi:hypothetical protein
MIDGKWEIPAGKGANDALVRYTKYVNEDVLCVVEQLAAHRCQQRDWRKHATVTRRDVEKAICDIYEFPMAEFIICTLAQTIPVLCHKLGPDWFTKDFDQDHFHESMGGWSTGEQLAGLFLLNVWNHGYAKRKGWHFNLFDAVGTLSNDNLLPMAEWMLAPQWP